MTLFVLLFSRLEQERKKQMEFERQLQKQREIEQQKEEERRKAMEQREVRTEPCKIHNIGSLLLLHSLLRLG